MNPWFGNKTDEGLLVKFPDKKPCEYAHVLKISLEVIAYGNVEIDENNDQLTVGTAVFNHSNKTVVVDMKCMVDQKFQSKKLTIQAQTKIDVSFADQIVNSKPVIELYANDCKLNK